MNLSIRIYDVRRWMSHVRTWICLLHLVQAKISPTLLGGENGRDNVGFVAFKTHVGWQFVCASFWGEQNSKIVCRELGYRKHLSTEYKSASNLVKMRSTKPQFYRYDITCESNEKSIDQCHRKIVKDRKFDRLCGVNTPHVFVKCDREKENGVLTLVDSFNIILYDEVLTHGIIQSGYLKMTSSLANQNTDWLYTCAEGWNLENSQVACRNLGFSEVEGFFSGQINAQTPQFREFHCYGNESILAQCQNQKVEMCRSNKIVILKCRSEDQNTIIEELNGEIRLRGGAYPSEGRVEIFKGREWVTICDDGWSIDDANVVCRQLGFGSAFEATHWAEQGEGLGKILPTGFKCNGTESHIKQCQQSLSNALHEACTHREDAGVRCRRPAYKPRMKIKLVGGKNSKEGRIEFLDSKGRWSGICGIGFGRFEGEVVCRQLGLNFVKWAGRSFKFGIKYKKRMFDVRCKGTENELSDCSYKNYAPCRYYDMASVICTKYAPDLVMDIDSFKESIKVDTHPLHHLRCSFEEGCLAPEVNEVWGRSGFHNRHLLKFTSRFINKGAVTFRPNIDKSSWKYHQCHEHFHSMETFATYDLIDKDGFRVAHGQKASFCLEDSDCEAGYKKTFNCTNKGDQGITVNCADNYSNKIDCQWIDVTGVPFGNYSLRVDANPMRNVSESDWLNNRAVCEIGYLGRGNVIVRGCTTDPCYQESFGGNSFGHCCHFPFIRQGQLYYKCIHDNNKENQDGRGEKERSWCSTTHDFDQDGKWGFCEEQIGGIGGNSH